MSKFDDNVRALARVGEMISRGMTVDEAIQVLRDEDEFDLINALTTEDIESLKGEENSFDKKMAGEKRDAAEDLNMWNDVKPRTDNWRDDI